MGYHHRPLCAQLLSQAHPVRCLAFTADSDKILTGHDDVQLRLWQLNTASPFANGSPTLADHTGAICSVAVSPDGEWFASSADDQTIRLWQSATGQCKRVLTTPPRSPAEL
ncbi:MAG: hypothetical protein HC922_06195 [Leptolyngbyaceae cyanobacterium SM2_3_12]|nr:hypothetical protein [Leptolyngbyaceae cyanobacterium SM2_3_12]